LRRLRGERLERTFAHAYETGGMRRTQLRGHGNILKRLLVHAGGFNLGLVMRALMGVGTPRGRQGRLAAPLAAAWAALTTAWGHQRPPGRLHDPADVNCHRHDVLSWPTMNWRETVTCATGC
jgi:transposase